MAYGIQILNDSGYIQIDQDYSNYVIVDRGTFNSWSTSDVFGGGFTVPNRGGMPIVFLRPPNGVMVGVSAFSWTFVANYYTFTYSWDSTNWTIQTRAYYIGGGSVDYSTPAVIEYAVAWPINSIISSGASSGFGLTVNAADNRLVFDSSVSNANTSYLRMSDVWPSCGPFSRNYQSMVLPHTAGVSRPWICINNIAGLGVTDADEATYSNGTYNLVEWKTACVGYQDSNNLKISLQTYQSADRASQQSVIGIMGGRFNTFYPNQSFSMSVLKNP